MSVCLNLTWFARVVIFSPFTGSNKSLILCVLLQPKEEDMTNVITIHNAVNERCWQEVMKWEQLHKVRERTYILSFVFRFDCVCASFTCFNVSLVLTMC